GRLGPLAQLEADTLEAALAAHLVRELEGTRSRGARVALVVAREQTYVLGPGRAARIVERRLECEQRRVALAREDDDVVALHREEVREVQDVVGRADDERVDVLLGHQRADALELRVVARPAHPASLTPAGIARTPAGALAQDRAALGLMFWFSRNRFSGSYLSFSATS